MLETVVRKAGSRVHLVGHSFGGLVALAVALRNRDPLASLVILEAPGPELLRDRGEHKHYRAFRRMTDAYFAAFDRGNTEAIAAMIDFSVALALMRLGRHGCAPVLRLWRITVRGAAPALSLRPAACRRSGSGSGRIAALPGMSASRPPP